MPENCLRDRCAQNSSLRCLEREIRHPLPTSRPILEGFPGAPPHPPPGILLDSPPRCLADSAAHRNDRAALVSGPEHGVGCEAFREEHASRVIEWLARGAEDAAIEHRGVA